MRISLFSNIDPSFSRVVRFRFVSTFRMPAQLIVQQFAKGGNLKAPNTGI